MDNPADSHTDAPVDHSSTEPKRSRSTCAIVLGVVLVSTVLVAGALALLLGPDLMASVHQIRGMAYYELGDLDQAITGLDQAIILKPDYASAYFNRGLAYHGKGDPARAIADFDQAIQLDPEFPEPHNGCGLSYSRMDDSDRAIADFTLAISLNPGFAGA